jgi:alcohol dehydrogenase class IV
MARTIPLLSYLLRIHNRFTATAAYWVRLPFQLGLCYKGASVTDGERHLSPVGNLTAVQKGVRRMEFTSGLQGAFTFLPQERVIFGKGSVAQLATEIDRLGCQRAFVITGTTIATKTDLLRQVQEVLGPRFVGVFYPIAQHTPRPDVVAAAARARAVNADVLVSLGGGSPVDGTKGVALCLAEDILTEAQLDPYRVRGPHGVRFNPQYQGKPIPHIAVTTTLSAGEFTSGVGITDPVRGVKESFGAPQVTPRTVILDPAVTVYTPAWLWASTGMRAVDHAVERLYSPKHNPLSDTLCQQALRYLFQHLPRATHDPQDLDARLHCQLGAWMSIIGFATVRTGISHAIGHQLGGHCHVPHGQTSCIMLPHAMEFNRPVAADRLALVAEAAGLETRQMTTGQAARAAIDAVRRLIGELDCPMRLRDVGVHEREFSALAQAVLEEVPMMENPRPISGIADVIDLLERAW